MNSMAPAEIEKVYSALQKRFIVEPGCDELAHATHFATNRDRLIHRWFHFKEGFAANILSAVGVEMQDLYDEEAVFIDPFCGSGTTLLAGDIQHKWRALRIGGRV
jgi:hypothetical protein